MSSQWHITDDPDEYESHVGEFLRSNPVHHTISAVGLESWRNGNAPAGSVFAWWTRSGEIAGAASLTPPYSLLIEAVPEEALPSLVAALSERDMTLPGVHGALDCAPAFAAMWRVATNCVVEMGMVMRLFSLRTLVAPRRSANGYARRYEEGDFGLAVEWVKQFAIELGEPHDDDADIVRRRASQGGIWFWCNEADEPVSMAGHTPPAAGVVRVGPVYTPPSERRKGYAEAVTHATCADVLRQGWDAVLFADQANPTSTGIYRALGFEAAADRVVLNFRS